MRSVIKLLGPSPSRARSVRPSALLLLVGGVRRAGRAGQATVTTAPLRTRRAKGARQQAQAVSHPSHATWRRQIIRRRLRFRSRCRKLFEQPPHCERLRLSLTIGRFVRVQQQPHTDGHVYPPIEPVKFRDQRQKIPC